MSDTPNVPPVDDTEPTDEDTRRKFGYGPDQGEPTIVPAEDRDDT